jgi:hypothetical protein
LINVISFSLWGSEPIYWVGAMRNIELASQFFPGWVCRFYVGADTPVENSRRLASAGAEIIPLHGQEPFAGMFWRFLAASDPNVDILLSRDCDSRIGSREAAAVAEWLSSDKDFHIMRDHPNHNVPILGGMWGCRNHLISDMDQIICRWMSFGYKGCDQDFLRAAVYPRVMENSIEHSEFGHSFGGKTKQFPTARRDYEFVGEVFDESDVRNKDGWRALRDYIDRNLTNIASVP